MINIPTEFSDPPPAESSSARNGRGGLQPPHTAQGAGRAHPQNRVLTVKLEPTTEQWKRLRDLSWQAMRYKNFFIRARLLESMTRKLWPDLPITDISKNVRSEEKGELSGVVYGALETEVKGAWSRDAKRILAGAPVSQWREADGLSIRGHKKENESGIRIDREGDTYYAAMSVQNKDCEGGCWMRVKISAGKELDRKMQVLESMLRWEIPIAKATINIKKNRGKMLLRLSYATIIYLPEPGQRAATLTAFDSDKRMNLRTETQTLDFTHKLAEVKKLKSDWDLIRRRYAAQIGRHRGASRQKRRKFSQINTADKLRTYIHQWTHEIVAWCKTQGIGHLSVLDIAGGDWPAYQFVDMLKYKAADAGIEIKEATLSDSATERAAKAVVKKAQRKAKKIGDAIRTLNSEIN